MNSGNVVMGGILIAVVFGGAYFFLTQQSLPFFERSIYDKKSVEITGMFRDQIASRLKIPGNGYIGEYAHVEDFYALDVRENRSDAGGGWVIIRRLDSSIEYIDQGQDTPNCSSMTSHAVPIQLVVYCRSGSDIIDRTTGKVIPNPPTPTFY